MQSFCDDARRLDPRFVLEYCHGIKKHTGTMRSDNPNTIGQVTRKRIIVWLNHTLEDNK